MDQQKDGENGFLWQPGLNGCFRPEANIQGNQQSTLNAVV
jgi:hypothetical protein